MQKQQQETIAESPQEEKESVKNNNNNNKSNSGGEEDDGGVDNKEKFQETFQIDEKTMQKLRDLEKSLRDRKAMPPPPPPAAINKSVDESRRERSGSFSNDSDSVTNLSLPGNFQRNTRLVKSARNYGKSSSGSNLRNSSSLKKQSSSVKASPLLERKTSGETSSS